MMQEGFPLQNLYNTRDIGGMRTRDGLSVQRGRLIRSGELTDASASDLKWLSEHIGLVIDLRTDAECSERPDPAIGSAEYVHLSVIRNLAAGISRDEASEKKAFSILEAEPDQAREFMVRAYIEFVDSEYSVAQYRRFVEILSEPTEKAVLWHCSAGKDRTGFAAAIVLELLGIHRDDIMSDYLKTNDCLEPQMQKMFRAVGSQLGGVSEKLEKTMRFMFGAKEEYLTAVYRKTEELYGSFQGFLQKGLHADERMIERFRRTYLTT